MSTTYESAEEHDLLLPYFREVGRTHPLTREEEAALGARVRAGDVQARNRLVTSNLRFGVAMARAYAGRGLPLADLIGAANVGLIEAAERFDCRNGARFITYASWWIRRCIVRALHEENHPVHVPEHVQDLLQKVNRATRELLQSLERPPDAEEIAAALGEPLERVELALANIHETESIDRVSEFAADGERTLTQLQAGLGEEDLDALETLTRDEEVARLMTGLPDREAQVVRHYYGFGDGEEGNLAEIGRTMHLSRERVRQIKTSAMARLRRRAQDDTR
jgi:RNA polymerase primary sigma factor